VATTYQLFEKAERIEEICAEAYHLLADQFSDDPEARDLFLRLETEELQHASRVRLLAARYRHDSRLLGAAVDAAGLDRMLAEANEVLLAIRRRSFAPTAGQACARAAELEERFARAHAELIASEGHPALREFFTRLAAQDRGHQELLRRRDGPGGGKRR
jgi:rubrerythrin